MIPAPAATGDGQAVVFIIGTPRSGTTLLARILGNHPDAVAPPEPWIMLALDQLGRVNLRHPANAQVLGTAVRDFAGQAMAAAARAAALALYGDWTRRSGARIFVDKTPRYWMILDTLAAAFPDARYLRLLRDPLDVAASLKTTWGLDVAELLRTDADEPHVFDFLMGTQALLDLGARDDVSTLTVRYEDLAAAPRDLLPGLLSFCGLDLPEDPNGLLSLGRGAGGGTDGQAPQGFGDSKIHGTTAPHAASIGAWRTVLTADDRQVILDALGMGRLSALGYGETARELVAMGARDNGPAVSDAYFQRARCRFDRRMSDIAASSTYGVRLPADAQARAGAALSETEWRALTDALRAPSA